MSESRQSQTYSAYKGSFINAELISIISYLKELKKNEKDLEASAFLSNAKKILEWIDWFLGYYANGNVPGNLDKIYIGAQFLILKPKIKTITSQYKTFYLNCDKENRLYQSLDRVYFLLIVRVMQTIERSPKNFIEAFPFLNIEEILKEIDLDYTWVKEDKEKAQSRLNDVKIERKKDEEILKLFPALFSIFNDSKKIKKADKKTKISLITSIFTRICNIFLPVVNHLPEMLPMYAVYKKSLAGVSHVELRKEINNSIEIAEKEMTHFSEFRDLVDHEGLILHTKISENLLFFYKCISKAQLEMMNFASDELIADRDRRHNKKNFLTWKNSELGIGLKRIDNLLGELSRQYNDDEEIGFLISNLEIMSAIGIWMTRLIDKAKTPHPLQMLRFVFLQDEMTWYFRKLITQFKELIERRDFVKLSEVSNIYLMLLTEAHDVIEALPRTAAELLPFADLERILSPVIKIGFDPAKIQPMLDYILEYKNHMPTVHAISTMSKEYQELRWAPRSKQLVERYERFVRKVSEKSENLMSAQLKRNQRLSEKSEKVVLDNKYYQYRFFQELLRKLNVDANRDICEMNEGLESHSDDYSSDEEYARFRHIFDRKKQSQELVKAETVGINSVLESEVENMIDRMAIFTAKERVIDLVEGNLIDLLEKFELNNSNDDLTSVQKEASYGEFFYQDPMMLPNDQTLQSITDLWKKDIENYINDRNNAYWLRDASRQGLIAVAGFFGSKSDNSEYKKRNEYVARVNKAMDSYVKTQSSDLLEEAIQEGLTLFKPRANETSGASLRSHILKIEAELHEIKKVVL